MQLAIIIVIILSVLFLFFFIMTNIAMRPRVWTLEYGKSKMESVPVNQGEDITVTNEHKVVSFDGYQLYVALLPCKEDSKNYVILSHGYTSTRYGVYKYAMLYRRLGYNCVIYDNRGHGANKKTYCTFGARESKDLIAIIKDTYERYGKDIHIGLHGESMGAGLQLQALQYQPEVDFIVNDCGYSEILPVLRHKCRYNFHLPERIVDIASIFAKLMYGHSFHEVKPIRLLEQNQIPICFVHGEADDFIHIWHSQKMYAATKGMKEFHLFEGATHVKCLDTDTNRYQEMLINFLNKVYKK